MPLVNMQSCKPGSFTYAGAATKTLIQAGHVTLHNLGCIVIRGGVVGWRMGFLCSLKIIFNKKLSSSSKIVLFLWGFFSMHGSSSMC